MKNLLAIVGDYYPHPSSNTNCFDPLLKALEDDGWHVDIVTLKKLVELPNYEKESNSRDIWRIDDPRSMNTILMNQLNNIPAPKYLKFINKLFAIASKGLFYIHYCVGKADKRYAGLSKKDTVSKCLQLHNEKHYDVVLSVSHPMICHEIAQKFLNQLSSNKPKWILYEFDPYCYNKHLYGDNCYKKLAPKQHDLFKDCDNIFLIPELYDFYKQTPFHIYQDKMKSIGFPNMKPVTFDETNVSRIPLQAGKVNCVFGGALGLKIRNPFYAMQTFSICNSEKIHWCIMTGYDLKYITNQIENCDKTTTIYSIQNRDTSYDVMLRADILVNIGNSVTFQTPGKIFEYMAMGKPIIHFQKTEDDPCLKYFANYPMVLIIDERENTPEKHAEMIQQFCDKYKGKSLCFEEVKKHIPQYTSENVSKKFVSIVNHLVNRG